MKFAFVLLVLLLFTIGCLDSNQGSKESGSEDQILISTATTSASPEPKPTEVSSVYPPVPGADDVKFKEKCTAFGSFTKTSYKERNGGEPPEGFVHETMYQCSPSYTAFIVLQKFDSQINARNQISSTPSWSPGISIDQQKIEYKPGEYGDQSVLFHGIQNGKQSFAFYLLKGDTIIYGQGFSDLIQAQTFMDYYVKNN